MAEDFRKFDDQGFPVPPRFEDLQFFADEPARRPKVSVKAKRWVLIVLIVGVVVPVVFGPQILSAGRGMLARWLSNQALQKYDAGDLAGALADLNQAIAWDPDSLELYLRRAACRQKLNDLHGSLADWSTAIELLESNELPKQLRGWRKHGLAEACSQRSWVYVRLGRKEAAMADANRAVELFPRADILNARAYARAIFGIELEDGLADVENALRQVGNDASMLDTRGYLLHLLGRNEEALDDLDRAIAAIEHEKRNFLRGQSRRLNEREFEYGLQRVHEHLAVMYHHRSLIYKHLGREQEAEQDKGRAEHLGYDPEKGVL